MQIFKCSRCDGVVYFENSVCLSCGTGLGFDPRSLTMCAVEPTTDGSGLFVLVGDKDSRQVRRCSNASFGACNWLTGASTDGSLCRACKLNRTIPDLSNPDNLAAWRAVEAAKKRLVYSLLRLGLPTDGSPPAQPPLTFDVAVGTTTGHLDGVVTIDVAEADAVERERRREHFDEPYRSLLGHLRHEAGHYYWPILVEQPGLVADFRELFGDERADYGEALAAHHANGPPADWRERCVSAYATAHPWEDWAETFAHYLHIVETIDTAEATGMEPRARGLLLGSPWPFGRADVYDEASVELLMERWIPLTAAMNELSRSMGHADFYPFVLTPAAMQKLGFVNRVIRARHAAAESAGRHQPARAVG